MIKEASEKYQVDPKIVLAIVAGESGFDRCQISGRVKKALKLRWSSTEDVVRKAAKQARKKGIKVDLGVAQFRYPSCITLDNALSDSKSLNMLAERLAYMEAKHKRSKKPTWAYYSNNKFSSRFMRAISYHMRLMKIKES